MRKQNIYYLEGDSYSKDILPFLSELFPKKNFIPLAFHETPDPQVSRILVLSPTVSKESFYFLELLKERWKLILLLDWNHSGYDDFTHLLQKFKFHRIFSPFQPSTLPYIKISSLHGEIMKRKVTMSALNTKDLFFCSQPLKEDRPNESFDQFDLIREVLQKAVQLNAKLYIKRHPRERERIPEDLINHPLVYYWTGTIEEALSTFQNWYGLNSIALYDAKFLGRKVVFLRKKMES